MLKKKETFIITQQKQKLQKTEVAREVLATQNTKTTTKCQ